MSLKPRGERPPIDKVVEDLRREVRAIPGINVFMQPDPEPQAGRPHQQEPLSVRPAQRARRRAARLRPTA